MGGIAIMSTGGTVALFIDSMTGSKTLVGLAVTVQALFMLAGQLSSAPYVRTIRKLPEFLFKNMFIQRIIPLFMAVPLLLGVGGNASVYIFLILFGLFWFYDGFLTVPWGELAVRALKPELRGHMMGMQVSIGGVASLLTGLLLTWLLATPVLSNYHRFAMVFILTSVILLPSIIAMRLARDPNPMKTPEKLDIRRYYARMPSIIRHSKPLQHALLARIPAFIGFSSVTFMVIFGATTLDLSETQVSWLVYANIVGGLVGGISLGEVSKRFGNKAVVILCNALVTVALGMAVSLTLFPSLGYAWLFMTCALASLTLSNWIGYFNYFLDIAPQEERSIYQVIGTSIGIPFSFVGFVMGAIIDNWGFLTVFYIGGISAVTAIFFSFRLMSKQSIQKMNT